jgi:PAS domain S-box-containing protein
VRSSSSSPSPKRAWQETPVVLLACDATGRITVAQGSGLRRISPGDGELVGQSVFAWEGRAPWLIGCVQRALHGASLQVEGELDGSTWSLLCAPLQREDGEPSGVVIAATDVTELSRAEERFNLIFDASPVPIIIMTADEGRVVEMNQSAEEATGWRRDELIGRTSKEVRAYWDKAEALRVLELLLQGAGRVRQTEVHYRRKDGSRYVGLTSFVPIELEGRTCVVVMAQDMTEHRQMEAQLRQTAKMEAIGQLAGGVAHDFNNILTVISGSAELMLRSTVSRNHRALLERIRRAAERASGLTRQLLAFSRKQVLSIVVLEPNAVVRDMVTILEPLLGEHVVLRIELAPDAGSARADRTQLQQILLNLAVNARDAMPTGGVLTVRTAKVGPDALGDKPTLVADSYVMLEVRDTGSGMTPDVQARIFEPFFTTKAPGEGTGLGLSTVYGIVRQSGGVIHVESAPGKGATFRVFLPRVETQPAQALPERAVAATSTDEATILLVEDEVDVREFVAQTLATHGYRILVARDGEEAEAVSHDHEGRIHLLLTDVVMPRIPGPEVARRLLAQRPDMRVMFMSGYMGQAPPGTAWEPPAGTFLRKPFSVALLLHEVQAALGRVARLHEESVPRPPEASH